MDRQQDQEATHHENTYRASWLLEHKAQLKWTGLAVLLLLLVWALPPLLSAYNATGQCLSSFSKLSESEMKLRVVKSIVAHYLEGARQEEKPGRLKIMLLGRSVTQAELIQGNQSGTLLNLLKEQPVLLSDADQLDQFAPKINAGEFTILNYYPSTTYELIALPGKSLHRIDSKITTEYFKKMNDINYQWLDKYLNNIGNYQYQYDYYIIDTACCNGKPLVSKEEIIDAKKQNMEWIKYKKDNPSHFIVSNCGSVWIPPHPQDQE